MKSVKMGIRRNQQASTSFIHRQRRRRRKHVPIMRKSTDASNSSKELRPRIQKVASRLEGRFGQTRRDFEQELGNKEAASNLLNWHLKSGAHGVKAETAIQMCLNDMSFHDNTAPRKDCT